MRLTKERLLFIFCFLAVPLFSIGRVSDKYGQGAVPLVNGKVVFERVIRSQANLSQGDMYQLLNQWALVNYSDTSLTANRILLSDQEHFVVACQGSQTLTFKSTWLIKDQAIMSYQLILKAENNTCVALVKKIEYDYPGFKQITPAEEIIVDEVALKGDKLSRFFGTSFRVYTIDYIDSLLNSLDTFIKGKTALSEQKTNE